MVTVMSSAAYALPTAISIATSAAPTGRIAKNACARMKPTPYSAEDSHGEPSGGNLRLCAEGGPMSDVIRDRFTFADFRLDSGAVLPSVTLSYVTRGSLAPDGRNAVLV